jgi:hypothetical protein
LFRYASRKSVKLVTQEVFIVILLALFKTFLIEKHLGRNIYFGNLATGHFERKFSSKIAGPGPDSSNDIGLKFIWRPGAEPMECQTHRIRVL